MNGPRKGPLPGAEEGIDLKDRFRIDGHKLHFHVDRLAAWQAGELIAPIYLEVSPSGGCNHRCRFCAFDYLEYRGRFLDGDVLKERLTEMGRLGVRSIMYAGEGEPFLHPRIGEIIEHTKASGIDVGITTNGVLLTPALADRILGACEWIKVSINGPTPELYAAVHRTSADDYGRVLENLAYAAEERRRRGHRCALGMQMLLLPENAGEVGVLARAARDAGVDYLVIKPYSHNPQSRTQEFRGIQYADYLHLADELAAYRTESFQVIFRAHTMKKLEERERGYDRCLALPFWAYLDSAGELWGCFSHLGEERFRYGNVLAGGFEAVWRGPRRVELLSWAERELDAGSCRRNCRMDEPNRYLWELRHPPEHVNFI
ncbi:MAG: radical SAM protein [Deltaproteobacteria bacterium]|nr:radical SAM protein [Deltaproteobacteria bacterium]